MKKLVKLDYVWDGDTACYYEGDKQIRLRCRFIDCPEVTSQAEALIEREENQISWGLKAKDKLLSLLPADRKITIYDHGKDDYGRTLSDWTWKINGKKVHASYLLIEAGLAVASVDWAKVHLLNSTSVSLLCGVLKRQVKAKEAKIGIWGDPNFEMPWAFRERESWMFRDTTPVWE